MNYHRKILLVILGQTLILLTVCFVCAERRKENKILKKAVIEMANEIENYKSNRKGG